MILCLKHSVVGTRLGVSGGTLSNDPNKFLFLSMVFLCFLLEDRYIVVLVKTFSIGV